MTLTGVAEWIQNWAEKYPEKTYSHVVVITHGGGRVFIVDPEAWIEWHADGERHPGFDHPTVREFLDA